MTDEPIFPGHWIRVMADYSCEGIWDSEGYPGYFEELPVSQQLADDIRAWADWYDRDCDAGLPDPRPFPRAEFAARGLALAKRLKAELLDWTIVYHDEQRAATSPPGAERSYYEYEVKAE